jgi:hypothetical protein
LGKLVVGWAISMLQKCCFWRALTPVAGQGRWSAQGAAPV